MKKRLFSMILVICMVISLLPAISLPASAAAGDLPTTMWIAPSETNNIPSQINLYTASSTSGGGGGWPGGGWNPGGGGNTGTTSSSYSLFLPGNVDYKNCYFSWADGLQGNDGAANYASGAMPVPAPGSSKTYTFTKGSTTSKFTVTTYQGSPSVKPIFIEIDESQGTIAAMNSDRDHNTTCTGEIVIDGERYGLPQMKGRGNYTWFSAVLKRGYNITLNQKVSILGIESGASKKWSLLNNIADHTLLRNKTAYDMAYTMGIGLDSAHADIWMNGEYQGCYLVTPKYDAYITSGGYLLEHDNKVEESVENGGDPTFTLPNLNDRITIKKIGSDLFPGGVESVETIKAAASQIEGWTKEAWEAINSSTGYNSKGRYYTEYIDLRTWAAMYLMQEYVKDYDVNAGSKLFRRDGTSDSDKLIGGPLWDCDNALGRTQSNPSLGSNARETDGYGFYIKEINGTSLWKSLGQHEDFMEEVYKVYNRYHALFDNVPQKIDEDAKLIEASAEMNFIKDPHNRETYNNSNMRAQTKQSGTKYEQRYVDTNTWSDYLANLKTFTTARSLFFSDNFTREIEDEGNRAIFKCGSHSSVTVYDTQDTTGEGHPDAKEAFARNSETGEISFDGEGQINFRVNLTDNYQLVNVNVLPTSNYKNLKEIEPGLYRITKVTGPIDVTIETAETICEHEFVDGVCTKCGKELFQVAVEHDEHCTVTAYPTQDLTTGGVLNPASVYPRNSATGEIDASGEGQASFVVAVDDGYEIASVTASPANYKNLKLPAETGTEGYYRITKISGPVTFKVTTRKRVGPYSTYFANGSSNSDWTVLNEDTAAYKLVKGEGLVLPTQNVDVKGNTTGWKNCFTTGIMEGDFKVVTKVHFPAAPKAATQQAKVMLWQDDNNYIAIGCQNTDLTVEAGQETNGSYTSISTNGGGGWGGGWGGNTGSTRKLTAASDGTVTAYFAIERVGATINLSYSQDGISYTQFSGRTANYAEPKIALFATEDSNAAPIDVNFEYFVVRQRGDMAKITNEEALTWAAQSAADYVAADLPAEISGDLTIDKVPHGYTVTLTSSNPSVISADGKVTKPQYATDVDITVNVSEGSIRASSQTVTVKVAGSSVCSHAYTKKVTAPTCQAGGYTTYTCSKCGDTYTADETLPIEHTFANGKCSVCGLVPYTATFNHDGHCSVVVYKSQAEDSDFVENAKTAYARSSDTGIVDISGEGQINFKVIPDSGYSIEAVTVEPKNYKNLKLPEETLVENGYRMTKVTGDVTVTITTATACPHEYSAVVTAPTCTQEGCTTYTCALCGNVYKSDIVEALGHNWDAGKITKQADVGVEGLKLYTCQRCGATRTEVIPAIKVGPASVDFKNPADASKFEIINKASSEIRSGEGLYMITTKDGFEPANGQLSGNAATTPKDLVLVPVDGDWEATLKFSFNTAGASNGYYQFFGFYAMEDYNNCAGIRGGDGAMQDFLRVNGDVTAETKNSAPGLASNGDYWYRIAKKGTTYTCYRSSDGKEFTEMFSYENTGIEAKNIAIDAYTGMTEGYTFMLDTLTFDGAEPIVSENYSVDFKNTADASKFQIVNKASSEIRSGEGLYMITTKDGFEPANNQLTGEAATTPKDLVLVPVSGDWEATLKFSFDQAAARNGYYQFFGFYAMEDYNNCAGIRGGDGAMQDFLRVDGNVTAETQNSAPGLASNGDYWYRIVKKGTTYTCYRSSDGKEFTEMFSYENTGIEAKNIAIDAYTGMTEGYTFMLDTLTFAGKAPAACDHDYAAVVTAPTCIAKGYTTYTCSKCGDSFIADETEGFGDHSFENGACTVCGEKAFTVTFDCGEHASITVIESQAEGAPVHENAKTAYARNSDTGAIDISGEGQVNFSIKAEIGYKIDEITAEPKNYKNLKTPVDTGVEGNYRLTKVTGDLTVTVKVSSTGPATCDHDYVAVVTAPTCTEPGYTTYTCSKCGSSYTADETPLAPHSFVNGKCAVCGMEAFEAVFVAEHASITVFDSQAADSKKTENAKTALIRNGDTGEVDVSGDGQLNFTVVPEAGYAVESVSIDPKNYKNLKGPADTGIENGYRVTKVTGSITVTVQLVTTECQHDYKAEVTAPTCTAKGYTTYTCAKCGSSYKADETDVIAHSFVNGKCSMCGAAAYVATFAAEHVSITVFDSQAEDSAKTENAKSAYIRNGDTGEIDISGDGQLNFTVVPEEGYAVDSITVEPANYKNIKEIAAGTYRVTKVTGSITVTVLAVKEGCEHDYKAVVTAPTCTKPGYTTYTCAKCGSSYVADEVAALGHDYKAVVTAPTCTAPGYTTYTCAKCGESYVADEKAALGHTYVNGVCTRCDAKDPDYKKECDGGDTCPSKAFKDAPKAGSWAHAGIDYCVENKLMNGIDATSFCPNDSLTRGQLVTILYRIAGEPDYTSDKSFSDVLESRYYAKAVIWAAENGVVTGYPDGTFKPDAKITREQIATILYRYENQPSVTGTLSFPDSAKVSGYAKNAMLWATQKGLINGVSTNGVSYLNPQANATRAQIASIIMRYLESREAV